MINTIFDVQDNIIIRFDATAETSGGIVTAAQALYVLKIKPPNRLPLVTVKVTLATPAPFTLDGTEYIYAYPIEVDADEKYAGQYVVYLQRLSPYQAADEITFDIRKSKLTPAELIA
jgi:hypothetical protein